MSSVKGTWTNGRIVLDSQADWPEGRRLIVAEDRFDEIEFMSEEEQRDDPESIEQWIRELQCIPPLPINPEEEAAMIAWRKKVKEFNLEAVRRQMEEGIV